jgi:hypothetical protein
MQKTSTFHGDPKDFGGAADQGVARMEQSRIRVLP